MILSSCIRRKAYIYTQTLNNTGNTKYWVSSVFNSINNLPSVSDEAGFVRDLIDELSDNGREWEINDISCVVKLNGNCLITIKPSTLDSAGRTSPILILFNVFLCKKLGIDLLLKVESIVGRELTEHDKAQCKNLAVFFDSSVFYLFFNILIKSKKMREV